MVHTETRAPDVWNPSIRQASGRTSHHTGPDDAASWSRAIDTSATTSSVNTGAASVVAMAVTAAAI